MTITALKEAAEKAFTGGTLEDDPELAAWLETTSLERFHREAGPSAILALIDRAEKLEAALRDLDEAFCSRHGCFPLDTVTEEQRLWNRAMTNARALTKGTETK
jgi:hypothetical protein